MAKLTIPEGLTLSLSELETRAVFTALGNMIIDQYSSPEVADAGNDLYDQIDTVKAFSSQEWFDDIPG